ncbi:MAG: SAF domain-containing protein [Symbiobacteriaceae bacterium]|nr:SAF domain-containing protein [Symbiobacteriaceae bacterium]
MRGLGRALRTFFTGRWFLSLLCLSLAGVGAFYLLPQMYKDQEATTMILRIRERLDPGDLIESRHLERVEVGAHNLPSQALIDDQEILGKFAKVTLFPGDYIFADKIGAFRVDPTMDAFLAANQRLVTVTPKNSAQVLAAHLHPGDIVSIATIRDVRVQSNEIQRVIDYPASLSRLEIFDIENQRGLSLGSSRGGSGAVAITSLQSSSNEDLVPRTITFIVTDEQAALLLDAEYNGGFHIIFRDRRP